MNVLSGRRSGLTLVELIMTLSILSILASLILPSAQLMAKRNKEIELKRNLRTIRNAIDDFKKTYDKAAEEKKIITSLNKEQNGYPESLEKLIEETDFGGLPPMKKRFLRRIPCDPFTPNKQTECKDSWETKPYTEGANDLYDVSSKSEETAIDGSKYKDW